MNWKPVIAITVLGGLGYALYRYVAKQKKLLLDYDIKPIGVSIVPGSTLDVAKVNVTLRLFNKAAIEATINKLYTDVYLNDVNVGYVENNNKVVIPARGYSDIQLQATFSIKLILKNITQLGLGSMSLKDTRYRLKGWANVSSGGFIGVTIPFDSSGSLKDF